MSIKFVLATLAFTGFGVALILAFIFGRRAIRGRYFRRRDARTDFVSRHWSAIVNGEFPVEQWSSNRMDRDVVEQMALRRLELAQAGEAATLKELLRSSGLLARRIREAGQRRAWRKRKALLLLSRMQLTEALPALEAALEDLREDVVIDAIRGLGRFAGAQAGAAIIRRLSRAMLDCPPHTLKSALADCFRNHSSALLGLLDGAPDSVRPVLAEILAEVAGPDTTGNLLGLMVDPLDDVRAAAARIFAMVRPSGAAVALALLARDRVWFVRLRAMAALGEVQDTRSVIVMIQGLCDGNRLVRLKAASALARMHGQAARILELAEETNDRYALQALVSEMERSGAILRLVDALADDATQNNVEPALLAAVRGGAARITADLMLNHPHSRVRQRLVVIVARSRRVTVERREGRAATAVLK